MSIGGRVGNGIFVKFFKFSIGETHVAMTVSAYLAKAPKEVHPKLDEIRTLIRAAAPQAEERISYGIVGYFSHGVLVYFGYWKEHIGL